MTIANSICIIGAGLLVGLPAHNKWYEISGSANATLKLCAHETTFSRGNSSEVRLV